MKIGLLSDSSERLSDIQNAIQPIGQPYEVIQFKSFEPIHLSLEQSHILLVDMQHLSPQVLEQTVLNLQQGNVYSSNHCPIKIAIFDPANQEQKAIAYQGGFSLWIPYPVSTLDMAWALQRADRERARSQALSLEPLDTIREWVHEINTPLSYVMRNVEHLEQYIQRFKIKILNHASRDVDSEKDIFATEPGKSTEPGKTNEPGKTTNLPLNANDEALTFAIQDVDTVLMDTKSGVEFLGTLCKRFQQSLLNSQAQTNLVTLHVPDLSKTKACLNEVLRKTSEMLKNLYPDIPIEWETFACKSVWVNVYSLMQAILNVLKNAMEATSGAREKDPSFQPLLRIQTQDEDQGVVCFIDNKGPEIEPSSLSQIFEKNYTTKKAKSHMGIGLFIAYRIIVLEHQGDLMIENIPNYGVRVTIRLF